MGRFDGKVVLVTGAARGQGRSHAIAFAREGADVVITDVARQLPTVVYDMSTAENLEETRVAVEASGRRCWATVADARDDAEWDRVIQQVRSRFGRLDIVAINHGIASFGETWQLSDEQWDEMISVNLTSHWQTAKATIPLIIEGGRGGAIVITSSDAGLLPLYHLAHYVAAKHGLIGLMKCLAVELAPYGIRANAVCPTTVETPMIMNPSLLGLFSGLEDADADSAKPAAMSLNVLQVPWIQPEDVTRAVVWLASDEARYITGVPLPVDAGQLVQPPGVPDNARVALANLEH